MDGNFDLLGDPIPEGFGKRGRPPHIATNQNRCKVMLLLAIGRKSGDIAAALGVTEPTLRKHYFRELKSKEEARFRVEGVRLLKLYEQVEAGNVGAMKELGKALDRADLEAGTFGRAQHDATAAGKPAKLGKKERALADAKAPDTETDIGRLMAMRQGIAH